jgi:hypothetical protein
MAPRFLPLALLSSAVLTALCLFDHTDSTAQEPSPEKLTAVLGSPAEWRIVPYQGAKADFTLPDVNGQPVLTVGPNGTVLYGQTNLAIDTEVMLRFKFTLAEKRGSTIQAWVGIKDNANPSKDSCFAAVSVPVGLEQESLTWNASGFGQSGYGGMIFRELPSERLHWPDMVRNRVEQDFAAATPLAKHWFTLRFVLRSNSCSMYLDDRLMRDVHGPAVDPTGTVRLNLFDGVQLAEVRLRRLPAENPRFEPVALGGYLNASKFKGDTLQHPALADALIKDIPFAFPAPDARGNDHIDLHPSWLQGGLLEGGFDGAYGEAARWRGTAVRDAGRIQLRVRNARYNNLHLIAAADGEPDTVPVVTAQFYRPHAGFPLNFAARVPLFTATATEVHALPAQLKGGGKGNLYLITIPLEPEGLASLSDLDHLELELTKQVHIHRSYPDPIYYSHHQAGPPSGVHVFALTLERPVVDVDIQPDQFAHIWTAPQQPSYTIKLHNITAQQQDAELELTTVSHDGQEKTAHKRTGSIPQGSELAVKVPLALKKYGFHRVEMKVKDASGTHVQTRSLALLHPDTRERGNWEEGRGSIYGFWDWGGGHVTPGGTNRLQVMNAAGAESKMTSFYGKMFDPKEPYPEEDHKFARDHGMISYFHAYQLSMRKDLLGVDWDPKKPAEMQAALIEALKKQPQLQKSAINKPELAVFFAEPLLGPISYISLPEYFGEPPYQLTPDEEKHYQDMHDQFVIAARAIKKEWPGTKCLMPWGIPTYPIPFLRRSKEATELMDGPALDIVLFERPPEMQLHQVTMTGQMWQLQQEWKKTGKPWPSLITIEGPCVGPAVPGALTQQQEADHTVRAALILMAYNTNRHLGCPIAFHCASSWGESHYGGGMCEKQPILSPKVVYSEYATMTRQLNRVNYVKTIPTGSTSVFCMQFKHYRTGELVHALWTLRGKRHVKLDVPAGAKVSVFDSMDNETGSPDFVLSTAPCYVRGLTADAKITLGLPDHNDVLPTANAERLAELGDGTWRIASENDKEYEGSHHEFCRRFPGKMTITPAAVTAPAANAGKPLAVHLEAQEKERKVMPFYTTLVPPKPIVIPGQARHLGLWVKGSSDWGRVVYCLRDAKGERWISVGKKGEWNVDDVHCWSAFNFDGWRYLRYEMPANAGYDCYREAGTSFWGPYGPGDGVVDLPLTLEKIIVERRTHVIAGTELLTANPDDVLLAGLFAEYASPADKTDEAVRVSRLRMPTPTTAPALGNPIVKMTESGVAAPVTVSKVAAPEREPDGTRCLVHFYPAADAKSYDVWVSPYPDGRGAVLLGKDWTEPGKLLTGLRASTDFYVFVVYTTKDGKRSKPSAGFKINLKDMFPMK